ncbi:MAG TPA: dienelactone hydrolase family protein [Fimbriimonadaceae bacterium]|nr:dienelactone hydrolase family protein [Fimbriimonadaceae bacterium]
MRTLVICAALAVSVVSQGQDWAKKRLEESPRHQEWVDLKAGSRTVKAFVVYPEKKDKATVVVLIHEIMGLTDWVQSVADQLAERGYIAIAPDFLSGMGPGGGRTVDFPDAGKAREAMSALPGAQVTGDLHAAVEYGKSIPSANGKVAVAGFCWGGTQSFRFATERGDLDAAFVFYGSGPTEPGAIAKIKAPVYGFYGGNDNRVNATIPESEKLMSAAGKKYEPVIYEGAGHGFMRAGEQPDAQAANSKARDQAWRRWLDLLMKL